MPFRHVRLVIAALAWVAVAGCACGDDDTTDHRPWCERSDGPYEGERALFAAYCDALSRCDLAAQLGYAFRCRQECVQTFEFGLTCSIEDDGSDDPFAGRLTTRALAYDEARGGQCIDWLATAECGEVASFLASGSSTSVDDDDPDPVVPVACQGALGDPSDAHGSVPEGEPCEDDRDCLEGLFCGAPEVEGDLVYCAACAPLPGPGGACVDDQCGPGAYCDMAVEPHLCQALAAVGEPCTGSTQCETGVCYPDRCLAPLDDGEGCETDIECASMGCIDGLCGDYRLEGEACDHDAQCATRRCFEELCIALRDEGESCEDPRQCLGDSCYRGQCAWRSPEHGPCDEDAHCAPGTICYEQVCTQPDRLPVGAPCEDGSVCITSTCIDGQCESPRANGNPCSAAADCQSNQCEDGLCGLRDGSPCWSGEECRSGRCPNHGVCTAPKDDGEACVYPEECLGNQCVDGLCFTPLAEGELCATSPQCLSGYCEDGRCAPRRESGEPCSADAGCSRENCDEASGLCGYPAGEACPGGDGWCQGHCEAGVCADDSALGGPCDRDAQCPDYCSSGECVELRPFGDVCGGDEECEGGRCVFVDAGFNYESQCRGPGQCRFDEECEDGEFCDDAHYPGTCTARRADGEPCDEDLECAHYCERDECVARRPYGARCAANEECEDDLCLYGSCALAGSCSSDADCTPPETCNQFRSPPTCTPPSETGGACRDDSDCATGWCSPITDTCGQQPGLGDACQPFECTRDAYCLGGTCVPRKGPGEPCDDSFLSDAECLGPYLCRQGECQIMPLDCAPSAPGEICAFLRVCTEDAYCDVLDGFTCRARVGVGDACDDFLPFSTSCVSGASCVEGTCTSYAAEGESCAGAACDPALDSCDPSTSTCRPLRFRGETCVQDDDCADGDCDDDGSGAMRCGGPCRRR